MPKAEQTKAFIIEKTAALFNKKGVAGTTLTDMEQATGLTKGSIYNNFENKDEVALAVFDFNLNKVNTLLAGQMVKAGSPREKLLAYVKVYGDASLRHAFPSGGCPILNTAVEADDTHPALRKRVNAALLNWKSNIENLIREGVKTKEFRPSVKAEETALTVMATIEGAIMIAKATGKAAYLKTVLHSVEKMVDDLAY